VHVVDADVALAIGGEVAGEDFEGEWGLGHGGLRFRGAVCFALN
jgi:hypothetical protein